MGQQELGLVSASVNGKQWTLTAENADAKNARETEINVLGTRVAKGQAHVLSSTDIHARNSFANSRGLETRDEQVNVGIGGRLVYRFAPASVTRLRLRIS
jgi:alpha-L-arabinofuranosidase